MGSAAAEALYAAPETFPHVEACQQQCISLQRGHCQKRKRNVSPNRKKCREDAQSAQPLTSIASLSKDLMQAATSCGRDTQPQRSSSLELQKTRKLGNLSNTSKMAVKAGKGTVQASIMTDSTSEHAARNWKLLKHRLDREGYLMLRNVLSASSVIKARICLLEELHRSKRECFAPGLPASEARAAEGAAGLGLLGRQDLAAKPPVSSVLEAPALFALMQGLLEETDIITTGYKWLRAVARSEFTGLHTDRVFLGRGTSQLLTAWLPLGSVGPDLGSLLVAAGSHRLSCYSGVRNSYGTSQVGSDGTRSGWLSDNGEVLSAAAEGVEVDWRVADCRPGDVVVLGLDVLHMSASNESDPPRIRLSCDTRWQAASEPRDPRLKVWHSDPLC